MVLTLNDPLAARALPSPAAGQPRAVRNPLDAIRRPPAPFSLLNTSPDALRFNEQSFSIAHAAAVSIADAPIDDAFLYGVAVAPPNNLYAFKRRGGRVLFAASFVAAVCSDEANERRGRPLGAAARGAYEDCDETSAQIFALYDPPLDAIIFSSAAPPPLNHERVVLHEFGHAMTLREWHRVAALHGELLIGLPRQIRDLLAAYSHGDEMAALREQVLEVLAEAYAWAVLGRLAELPRRLQWIIQDVVAGEPIPLPTPPRRGDGSSGGSVMLRA